MQQNTQDNRSYFDTTNAPADKLPKYNLKTQIQNGEVLKTFLSESKGLTPCEAWERLGGDKFAPLTSVRRSVTVLTNQGLLVKTDEQRPGIYGRPVYVWMHPDHQEKGQTSLKL